MKKRSAIDGDREKGEWLTLDERGNLWTHAYIPWKNQVYSQGYSADYVCAALENMRDNWPGVDELNWDADVIGDLEGQK